MILSLADLAAVKSHIQILYCINTLEKWGYPNKTVLGNGPELLGIRTSACIVMIKFRRGTSKVNSKQCCQIPSIVQFAIFCAFELYGLAMEYV